MPISPWPAEDPQQPPPAPVPLFQPAPRHPPALQRIAQGGEADVRMLVDTQGRVRGVDVVSASHPLFSRAVIDAVRAWRFAPARNAQGEAVRAWVRMSFRFELED